jgi:hypothetical protein
MNVASRPIFDTGMLITPKSLGYSYIPTQPINTAKPGIGGSISSGMWGGNPPQLTGGPFSYIPTPVQGTAPIKTPNQSGSIVTRFANRISMAVFS